jgi:hypothetical protein
MKNDIALRRSDRFGALKISTAIAAIMIAPGMARAACDPSPTQVDTLTTCSEFETTTLVVAADGSSVVVNGGALISSSGMSSILVTSEPNLSYSYAPVESSIVINGTVRSESGRAILVTAHRGDPQTYTPNQTRSAITLGKDGVVSGVVGIEVSIDPRSYNSRAEVDLTNSGRISSSAGGYALLGDANGQGGFRSIVNTATGVIGAISGQTGTLTNEGLIDGGSRSAFTDAGGYYGTGTVVTSGPIQSSGAAPTLYFYRSYNPGYFVDNSGIISQSGTGNAIEGLTQARVLNNVSGTITSNASAIAAPNYVDVLNEGVITGLRGAVISYGALNFVNRGTINGLVYGAAGSVIDNVGGTINGNLLLGDGDDLFIGDPANFTSPIGTINGVLDAGGGTDTLRFTFTEDTSLDTAITPPPTIERLSLKIGNSKTLTLTETFAGTTPIAVGGGDPYFYNPQNQFVNSGTITTVGTALASDGSSGMGVTNGGTISGTLADRDDFAAEIDTVTIFTNSGTIIGTGGGGLRISSENGPVYNSGTIMADYIAVQSASLNNSGTVRSFQDIGVDLQGGNRQSVNSGTIEGAVAGARVYYTSLTNSGTISSSRTGVEVGISGEVNNLAGGVINGGIAPSSLNDGFGSSARITNAGIINGNVDLGRRDYGYGTGNIFVASPGGIVNGNIHLGQGRDIFATALNNDGPGEFAGLTGNVTGEGQETLRYLVDSDATATVAVRGIFSALAYDLSNDAKLILSAPSAQALNIGFSGTGSVDLTADLIGNAESPVLDLRQTSVQDVPTAVDVVSRGTIIVQPIASYDSTNPAVVVGSDSSFTNAGTIVVRKLISINRQAVAIRSDGGNIINDGIIRVDGAVGMMSDYYFGQGDAPQIVNNGIITQLTDGAPAIGMVLGGSALNRGQIITDDTAVQMLYSGTLTNSGVITSRTNSAISGVFTSLPIKIINENGGTIGGGPGVTAITLSAGSQISNAGTINGDVSLFAPFYNVGLASAYANSGGTLNGNLTFGSGNDFFASLDGQTGVSGTIDTGAGFDTFIRSFSTSQSIDVFTNGASLPAGFEGQGVGAIGADTVVTLTASGSLTRPLLLVGDGKIVNTAALLGVNLGTTPEVANRFDLGWKLAFVNQGTIAGGVAGYAASFTNEGVINQSDSSRSALSLLATGDDTFLFSNSGTIAGSTRDNPFNNDTRGVRLYAGPDLTPLERVTIQNSGTILGGLSADMRARQLSFTNNGTVAKSNAFDGSVILSLGQSFYGYGNDGYNPDSVEINNSGTLASGFTGYLTASRLNFDNSGTIDEYVELYQYAYRTENPEGGTDTQFDQESASLTNSGTINGVVNLYIDAKTIDVTNSGTISVVGAPDDDDAIFTIEGTSLGGQDIAVRNSGTIATDRTGGSGLIIASYSNDVIDPLAGEESAARAVSTVKFVNSGTLQASGSPYYSPAFTYGAPYDFEQPAYIMPNAALAVHVINGEVTIDNQTGGVVAATGSIGAGDGIPEDLVGLGGTAVFVTADRLTLTNAGTIAGIGGILPEGIGIYDEFADLPPEYRTLAGAIHTLRSVDNVTNLATGRINGSIDLGTGDDSLVNFGTIRGDIAMGSGDDRMTHNINGVLTGVVNGGEGTDILTIAIDGGGMIDQPLFDRFTGFESQRISGSGMVTIGGPLTIDSLVLQDANLTLAAGQTLQTGGTNAIVTAGGTNSIVNLGTIAGGVDLRQGSNRLINAGRIGGAVGFGSGDDELVLAGNPSFVGPVDGGGGNDRLILATGGSDAAPLELDLSMAIGFEQTRQDSGTIALSGSYATGSFDILAGRLFGRAGSNLTAGTIRVARGGDVRQCRHRNRRFSGRRHIVARGVPGHIDRQWRRDSGDGIDRPLRDDPDDQRRTRDRRQAVDRDRDDIGAGRRTAADAGRRLQADHGQRWHQRQLHDHR